MGVSCRIYIQKPREGIHRAGQPINGILSYAIDEPTEYQTAILSLIGTAKCQWTEHKGKHSHVYTGKEAFLTMHLNILNKPSDETITLPVGAYEFRFEFILPYDIPSSFEDKHGNITYQVKAKFEKPSFFSLTRRFEKQIIVYGNVNPTTPVESLTYGLQKKLFKLFSSTDHIVDLKVRISKSFLTPGENTTLDLSLTNDSDTDIPYLTTELCSKTTYIAEGLFSTDNTKIVDKTLEECTTTTPLVLAYKTANFACVVPTPPHIYSIQNCNIISKEFYIRVTINLPFPHRNATSVIPVVIGEGRYGDCSGIVELEDNFVTGLEPSISGPPPSYWEVMNEDKAQDESGQSSKE
ncbi:arrestin domain-containing protein 2-like [Leguminivora glycinivorella]|uniref:arrestin domain-containing protein 2-like n=1 Tax=Leguminivora glycinivorella TaxID=1035111 RepID=UPI00200DD48C|nr:arrestin domain-containing protein 2-like [Leguminivora glycinivorella]